MRRAPAGVVATTLAAVAVVVLPTTPAVAVESGTFTALTYNIAGLPEGLSSAPTPRESATTAIGQRLGPVDIVHVQEDFNYHAHLYAGDTTHPYRTPTSGGVPFGSGLNSLSKYRYDEGDFERVTWNDCNLNSGDCLTPKGFTFMRVRLAEGTYIDFYNLHADAGSDGGDLSARAANFAQLSAFVQSHSAGNAVVVMGDTNTRYTRTTDGTTIRNFAAANGLTDPWVELVRGGDAPAEGSDALTCDAVNPTDDCEVVDKIWYRSSRFVTLRATAYSNDHADFLEDGTGRMLSDHYPISTRFSWTTNPAYQLSDQHGGPHGDYFNDIDRVAPGAQATAISLRAGERVDQVGLTLRDGTTLSHGGTGGTYYELALGSTEYVTSAYLCQAKHNGHTRISYARFTTNLGRTLAGGTTAGVCVTRTAPEGWQIVGFHGRSGDEVDKLGFIYTAERRAAHQPDAR